MQATSAVTRSEFRDAMARLGAAVHIITTDGPAGCGGFTASAVCSVSDEPPSLLVCLNRAASVYPTFQTNGVLCVNVLTPEHHALATLFGGKTPMADRFAAAQWCRLETGAPLLQDAMVSFDCRVVRHSAMGTHDVLFCEVIALAMGETAQGLIYFERGYHTIGPAL